MRRERAHADAHGQRQALGGVELEGVIHECRLCSLEDGTKGVDLIGRSDDEQLVGTVAAVDDAGGQLAPKQVHDGEQRAIAGLVSPCLVEKPEVVDVDERDREGADCRDGPDRPPGPRRRQAPRGSTCWSADPAGSPRRAPASGG